MLSLIAESKCFFLCKLLYALHVQYIDSIFKIFEKWCRARGKKATIFKRDIMYYDLSRRINVLVMFKNMHKRLLQRVKTYPYAFLSKRSNCKMKECVQYLFLFVTFPSFFHFLTQRINNLCKTIHQDMISHVSEEKQSNRVNMIS